MTTTTSFRALASLLIALILTLGLLVTTPAAQAAERNGNRQKAQHRTSQHRDGDSKRERHQRQERKKGKKPKKAKKPQPPYRAKPGLSFNNPMGNFKAKNRINDQIADAIDHAKPGSKIFIATWNFDSQRFTNRLLWAYQRGVTVRLLMQGNMARTQGDGDPFWRLHHGLNRKQRVKGKGNSWARKCEASCRGFSGLLHSKFYLFSHTGKSRRVVMNSSGNLTDVATVVQWNDMYTLVNHGKAWNLFVETFWQMSRDKFARPGPWRQVRLGPFLTAYIWPVQGKNRPKVDPVVARLETIKCKGARNTHDGRTRVRIAQTAWMDDRGVWIAKRVRRLWDRGCNVKVVHAALKPRIRSILKQRYGRGPVPLRKVARDNNGDGALDRYLHMKALVVRGHVGKDRSKYVTWSGSSNWTRPARKSDEVELKIVDPKTTKKYEEWVNRLFRRPWYRG